MNSSIEERKTNEDVNKPPENNNHRLGYISSLHFPHDSTYCRRNIMMTLRQENLFNRWYNEGVFELFDKSSVTIESLLKDVSPSHHFIMKGNKLPIIFIINYY